MPERSSGPRPKGRQRRKRHVEQHHHHHRQRTTSPMTVRDDRAHTERIDWLLDLTLGVGQIVGDPVTQLIFVPDVVAIEDIAAHPSAPRSSP